MMLRISITHTGDVIDRETRSVELTLELKSSGSAATDNDLVGFALEESSCTLQLWNAGCILSANNEEIRVPASEVFSGIGTPYRNHCVSSYRDGNGVDQFLPHAEILPLWNIQFANDFIVFLYRKGFKRNSNATVSITDNGDQNLIDTYFGVQLLHYFRHEINTSTNIYLSSRLSSDYGAVIDAINSQLGALLKKPQWHDVKRFAMTLYDNLGRYCFASANASFEVAQIAREVESAFNDREVEAFTSRLLNRRIGVPTKLFKSGKDSFDICVSNDNGDDCEYTRLSYSAESHDSFKSICVKAQKGNTLFPQSNMTEAQQRGLALNFDLVEKLDVIMYYIPLWMETARKNAQAYVIVLFERGDPSMDIPVPRLNNLLSDARGLFYPALMIENNLLLRQIAVDQIRTAIGSIMSRNGSHNIGSHVLAALSHNVGTMPDDRILYQYIQHRMDYIATVTTDFPTWTQPTNFVGSLLRTFLEQRHLLDHITESEGLSSWQFQNLNLTEVEWKNQHDRLQFFVRRRNKNGKYDDFITYNSSSDAIPLKYDVALAIPGGTVGQHAFYTILENVIRNAAKHDWSVAIEQNRRPANLVNLPLYIDFEDDDNAENVVFEIWTKLTPIEKGLKPLTGKKVSEFLDLLDENAKSDSTAIKAFQALPVQHRQQVLIERSFIGSGGNLRRENWGLAEMKISAGYLQRRSVSEIGGIAESNHESANAIILPCLKEHEGRHYLCYRFSVPKPREVLVIVDDDLGALKPRIDELRNFGVFVKNWSAIVGDANERARELNYRFVIHPNVTLDVLRGNHVKFPFRVLSGCEPDKGLSRHIPRLENYKELVASLLDSRRNIGDVANDLLTSVYRCWCRFLTREEQEKTVHDKTSRVIVERKVGLVVAPNEGGSNCAAGRSLIADADVLKFLLRESFSTCVDQFLTLEKYDPKSLLAQLLKSLKLPESIGGQAEHDVNNGGFALHKEIARQLTLMLKAIDQKDDEVVKLAREISDQLERYYGRKAKTFGEIGRSTDKKRVANKLSKTYAQSVSVVAGLLEEHSIDRFVQYLAAMHRHTAKLFKQYEEKIVSLPKGYSLIDSSQKKGNEKHKEDDRKDDFPISLRYTMPPEDKKNVTDIKWIAYRRHDYALNDKLIYAEPLSGTQSYLSQLMQMQRELPDPAKAPSEVKNLALRTRLVENGLMKLLVIDERVAKFVREHAEEVAKIYHSMNITVVDDKADDKNGVAKGIKVSNKVNTIACFAADFHKQKIVSALTAYVTGGNKECATWLRVGKVLNRYDMLIVHQGILDKWFPGLKGDRKLMQKLIEGLKKVVRYVVITTGRGTPPNIPEDAHLIPFAVVESALFRKYPEKLILVDTVMNVVPVGNTSGEEDV